MAGAGPGPYVDQLQQREHSLSLKVMRLTKPSFHVDTPIVCEDWDFSAVADRRDTESSTKDGTELSGFGLSDMFVLPAGVGTIFVGETFASYLSIHNFSGTDVANVGIKAELQTASNRNCLLDIPTNKIPTFKGGNSNDYMIEHKVKEEGIHILVCSVNYERSDGKKFFRKCFKFEVQNPLDVKTSTTDVGANVFLQVQIRNISVTPLLIDQVQFNPVNIFTCTSLNDNSFNHYHSCQDLEGITYMKPTDTLRYLYRLTASAGHEKEAKTANVVGRMQVLWKTNTGEEGRLCTEAIQRKLPWRQDMDLKLSDLSSVVTLEQPFQVTCSITNCCERSIMPRLVLAKNRANGIMINGVSGQNFGLVAPQETKSFPLTLFPVKAGVQKITGLRIIDAQTDKSYDFDDISDVYVQTTESC